MLIVPPGHARATAAGPRPLSLREKRIVVAVGAVTAALLVIVVISIAASGGHRTGGGCIDVHFPISIGGQELYGCGARAKQFCAAVGQPGGTSGVAGQAVAEQCRKVGLPVGSG